MSTGRFYVYMKSGRKFCVEPYGNPYVSWGNIDPATKKLERVHAKNVEVIDESNSIITKENGFKNICMLDPGFSPIGFIDFLDSSGVEKVEMKGVTYL